MKVCEIIAKELDVPVENILGLAAAESQYGTGRIAVEYNTTFPPCPGIISVRSGSSKAIVTKLAAIFLRFQFVRDLCRQVW